MDSPPPIAPIDGSASAATLVCTGDKQKGLRKEGPEISDDKLQSVVLRNDLSTPKAAADSGTNFPSTLQGCVPSSCVLPGVSSSSKQQQRLPVSNDGGKSAATAPSGSQPPESELVERSATKTCSVKLVDIVPKAAVADNASTVVKTNATGEPLKRDLPVPLSSSYEQGDEPNAKKARPTHDPTSASVNRVLLKPKDFIDLKRRTAASNFKASDEEAAPPTAPPSTTTKLSAVEDSKLATNASSAFDNVEEELGRLFGSSSPHKKDNSKVTISPVRSSNSTTTTALAKDSVSSRRQSSPTSPITTSAPALAAPTGGGSVTIRL